ncbi:MAG: hypothetical protein ACI37T_05190 [Candidatus Gastranaerophilaceae bacterium]
MEHYITIACVSISATALVFFAIIKACDWLIGLKYKSIAECSKTRHEWAECLKTDYASKETVSNLKEDMDEMKCKINDIHDVIMTFAVNSFKGKQE